MGKSQSFVCVEHLLVPGTVCKNLVDGHFKRRDRVGLVSDMNQDTMGRLSSYPGSASSSGFLLTGTLRDNR